MGRHRAAALAHLPEGVLRHRAREFRYVTDGTSGKKRRAYTDVPAPFADRKSAATLVRNARKNAGGRGLSIAITVDEVLELLKRANGCCEVTGIRFSIEKPSGARMRPWCPSLDRIDRTMGYAIANCRIVCAYANLALNEFGDEAFGVLAAAFRRRRRRK